MQSALLQRLMRNFEKLEMKIGETITEVEEDNMSFRWKNHGDLVEEEVEEDIKLDEEDMVVVDIKEGDEASTRR